MHNFNFSYDWANTPSHIIIDGVSNGGTKLLVLFLRDYVAITNEQVNPSCQKCLNNYITFIKNLYMKSEEKNVSNYALKAKYFGVVLEFGSSVYVDNDNITDEYGLILLNRFKELGTPPEQIFEKFPEEFKTPEAPKVLAVVKDSKEVKADKTKEAKPAVIKTPEVVKTPEAPKAEEVADEKKAETLEVKTPEVVKTEDEDIIIVD